MSRAHEHPTPEQLARRASNTRSARRRKARQLAELNRVASTCQRKQGPGTCGGRLETVIDRATGTAHVVCPRCVRRLAGVCLTCPRPVEGRVGSAIRCAHCKVNATLEAAARYKARNHEALTRRQRERVRNMPAEAKAKRLQYKRLWRRANPEKVHGYKVREQAEHREKLRAWHAARRATKRAELAAKARERYYAITPTPVVPPCRDCGAVIPYAPPGRPKTRCDACVPPSLRARRRAEVPAWERPVVERSLRTCVTPGCDIVVTHRAKKCPKCKAKHAQVSRMLLAAAVAA